MDVRDRGTGVRAVARWQEADRRRRRHHHSHRPGELLDPLVVGEGRDALAQRRVATREDGVLLQRAAHAGAELEHLDLHRHDPGEHHAEHRDPPAAADQAVEQDVVREPADERSRRGRRRWRRGRRRAGRGRAGPGGSGRARDAGRTWRRRRAPGDRAADAPRRRRSRSACAYGDAAVLPCALRAWWLQVSSAALLELASGPQVSGLRSWVGGDLAGGRRDRAARQQLGLGVVTADAHREIRRADAAARAAGEEPLDAPVLERVEGDRRKPAARRAAGPRRAAAPRRAGRARR